MSTTSKKPLQNATQPWHYDVRVLQRNVTEGVLDQKTVNGYLTALPDATPKSEPFNTSLSGREDADDAAGSFDDEANED